MGCDPNLNGMTRKDLDETPGYQKISMLMRVVYFLPKQQLARVS